MDRPDIGIEAEKILGLLLRADPMMNATNRRRYNDRAIGAIQDVIRAFVLAHDFENERYRYLKEMWGHIAVFIRIMRCIGEVNAIELQPKHEPMSPNLLYEFGELAGDTTFLLNTTDVARGVNHYFWTFETPSTAPTITWPAGLTWQGGSAPTINASKHYEISVLNSIAVTMEV